MNLQEAINELERGTRTFKAFEFLLETAKTVQGALKEQRSNETKILQLRSTLEDLQKQKEEAIQENERLANEANKIIDEAKAEAKTAALKITAAADAQLLKTQHDIEAAKETLQKTRKEVDLMGEKKTKLNSELGEINEQINVLKTNLRKLMGE